MQRCQFLLYSSHNLLCRYIFRAKSSLITPQSPERPNIGVHCIFTQESICDGVFLAQALTNIISPTSDSFRIYFLLYLNNFRLLLQYILRYIFLTFLHAVITPSHKYKTQGDQYRPNKIYSIHDYPIKKRPNGRSYY